MTSDDRTADQPGATSATSPSHAFDALEALGDATRAIAGVLDVESVLQLIVDRVRELVDARYAALGIVDGFGGIERFITSGISDEARAGIGDPPRGHGLLGLIIRERRTYRIPDIARHPDSYGFPPNHPPMTSFLGVPVVAAGRSVGNLYLTDKVGEDAFTEADERLVELFSRHAGIAIDNARLHEQVQRFAVVEERERIGRDLHDGIIQDLYAVSLSLEGVEAIVAREPAEAAATVDRAIDAINVAIRDIRSFILGLRPHLLEQDDLVEGLDALVAETRLNSMIDVDLGVTDLWEPSAVDPATRSHLVHIAREALSNIARHSSATRATVDLSVGPDAVALTIADAGSGFDPELHRSGAHQGLGNIRERAAAIGARLSIASEPGRGTRIIVTVPTNRRDPAT